jgi:hypothetical protein
MEGCSAGGEGDVVEAVSANRMAEPSPMGVEVEGSEGRTLSLFSSAMGVVGAEDVLDMVKMGMEMEMEMSVVVLVLVVMLVLVLMLMLVLMLVLMMLIVLLMKALDVLIFT